MYYARLFLLSMLVFFTLDMVWLGLIAKNLYIKNYGAWLRLDNGQLWPVWWAVLIVYMLFALGTLTLVLPLAKGLLVEAFLYGALLGFVVYGVYDFTCFGILKDWPIGMAFIDWMWGTFLCAFSAMVTGYIARII